jgi:hypothetical protein
MEYFAEPEKGRVQASVIGNSEAVLMNVYEHKCQIGPCK